MSNAILRMASVCLVTLAAHAGDVPLGHPEFMPTPERPVGWRGDGSAVYPGAAPVTTWDGATGANLRWKTPMPSLANSQPIVVGDAVFTTAEPRFLICVGLADGKIRWQADVDPVELQGAPADVVAKVKEAYPLFAQICQIQLETGINGTRGVPAERGILAWKRMREVLLALQKIGIPDLEVTVPDDAEIERESKDFEHSGINGHVRRPVGWFEKKYGFRTCETWPHDGGFVLPAPVSDGKRVYVAMGQGQVAAYDLTGKKVWGRHHAKGKGGNCAFYPSPIIVDGTLIVQHDAHLRAYALDDGAIRWDVEKDVIGGGYNMGTAHILRPDGKTAYLVLANGHVVQVADGKTIGDLRIVNAGSEWGGVSVIGDGRDTVYFFPGNNGGGEMVAIRVIVADGAVTRQDIWKGPHKNRSITPVLHEGLLYHSDDDKATVVRDATTGEIVKTMSLRTRWPSFAVAGRNLFIAVGNGDVQIASLGRDAAPVSVNRLGETGNKNPGGICEAAPTFAGDAVILRTHGFLYCFGKE